MDQSYLKISSSQGNSTMKKIILAPNPTGTGHNMRMLSIGQSLLSKSPDIEITVLLGSRQDVFTTLFEQAGIQVCDLSPTGNGNKKMGGFT